MTLKLLSSRWNVVDPLRRLLRPLSPVVTAPVEAHTVTCAREEGGVAPLERCLSCDRLVMLEVDADGNGTVECRPDGDAAGAE